MKTFYVGDVRFEAESYDELEAASALLREERARTSWAVSFLSFLPLAEKLLGRRVTIYQLSALFTFEELPVRRVVEGGAQ